MARASNGLAPDRPIENLSETLERAGVLILALPVVLEDAMFLCFVACNIPASHFSCGGRSGDRQRFSLVHELGHLSFIKQLEARWRLWKKKRIRSQRSCCCRKAG